MANKYLAQWIIDTASASNIASGIVWVSSFIFSGYAAGTDTAVIADGAGNTLYTLNGDADLREAVLSFPEPVPFRGLRVPTLSSGILTIVIA